MLHFGHSIKPEGLLQYCLHYDSLLQLMQPSQSAFLCATWRTAPRLPIVRQPSAAHAPQQSVSWCATWRTVPRLPTLRQLSAAHAAQQSASLCATWTNQESLRNCFTSTLLCIMLCASMTVSGPDKFGGVTRSALPSQLLWLLSAAASRVDERPVELSTSKRRWKRYW